MSSRAQALVVGVPETTFDPDLPRLSGATEDATAMAALLRSRGFAKDDVAMPIGSELDAGNIKCELKRLASSVQAGDLGVFYFSGHGYRLKDGSNDEADWDECLVCSDDVILDDWFYDEFWPTTDPDSRWVACVDACFSETAVRYAIEPPPLPVDIKGRVSSGKGSRWRLVLSACGDDERALELAKAASDFDGLARSAVTRALLASIMHDPTTGYDALWADVARQIDVIRRSEVWVGVPRIWYSGPNDSLKRARAFHG